MRAIRFLFRCGLLVTARTSRIQSMHAAMNRLALAVSVRAIVGLLYSPMCVLSCASSDCFLLEATKVAKESQQASHCHHKGSEEQSSTPEHHPTSPQNNSGNCPAHTDGIAVLASLIKAPIVLQQNVRPIAAALEPACFSLDGLAVKSGVVRSFRSPPIRAVISVYRI